MDIPPGEGRIPVLIRGEKNGRTGKIKTHRRHVYGGKGVIQFGGVEGRGWGTGKGSLTRTQTQKKKEDFGGSLVGE